MNYTTNLTIEGKEVSLDFGANWFYEHYKEDSGIDLMKDNLKVDVNSMEILSVNQSLIWAAYQTNCSIKEVQPEVTRAQVKKFVMSMDLVKAYELFVKLLTAKCGGKLPEGEPEEKKTDLVGTT